MKKYIRKFLILAALTAFSSLCGCRQAEKQLHVKTEHSPVPGTSLVPQATRLSSGKIVVSWQRPLDTGGYAFEMAIDSRGQWSEVRTITRGVNLSMFTADLPAVAELPNGNLLAYWELKKASSEDPYATAILTAVSSDDGKTWSQPLTPYDEVLAGQHSFISSFPDGDGIGLLWLDAAQQSELRMNAHHGIEHMEMGSIGLRYAALNARGEVARGSFVDAITCECCPTSAAVTSRGPVVVYRGRQEATGTQPSEVDPDRPTVRDIHIARLEGNHWTEPHLVHADNWVINACPDNGPSVDANANNVVVAWWTRSGDEPKAQVAFSSDAGDTFSVPVRIDAGNAEGQVTVAMLPDGKSAIVGWLEAGMTWARFVRATGKMSSAVSLGRAPKHSRLPRWIVNSDGGLTAVWTKKEGDSPVVAISRISF